MGRVHSKQFGIVAIGPYHLAIPIDHLSEVFLPRKLQDLPCPSDQLLGGAELRDSLVPVLDIRGLLGLEDLRKQTELGVVMRDKNRRLAILVDEIVGIHSLERAQIQTMSTNRDATDAVFGRSFRHGDRFVSVIDPEKVMVLPGVYAADAPTTQAQHGQKEHAPSLTFSAGGTLYSVPAIEVYAAIPKRQITQSAITSGPVLGEISYHDRRIPVLCPIQTFGLGQITPTAASEIVALRFDGALVIGFAVDAIQKIGVTPSGGVSALPAWNSAHGFIQDVIIQNDGTQIYRIDVEKLRASAAHIEISKLSQPDQEEEPPAQPASQGERNIIHEKRRYLVVEAGIEMAIPLSDVNRIIATPDEITPTQGATGGFVGFFAQSGYTIGLFDLAAMRHTGTCEAATSKVLLTGPAEEQSGFRVDRVAGIELSEWREVPAARDTLQAPALVQLGNGDTATVLPTCSLSEILASYTHSALPETA